MEIRDVVLSIVSITIGILLVGSLLVPQATETMQDLTDIGQGSWASLVGVTVVMVIISLILIAVLGFSKKGRKARSVSK